ncbi:WhiB family transcriptional regulator [Pseudonocardia sp. Ae707_Ps2]
MGTYGTFRDMKARSSCSPQNAEVLQKAVSRSWWGQAACVSMDTEMFFPSPHKTGADAAAKQTCAACPVRRQCLEHALSVGEYYGIWGGLAAHERQRLPRWGPQGGVTRESRSQAG